MVYKKLRDADMVCILHQLSRCQPINTTQRVAVKPKCRPCVLLVPLYNLLQKEEPSTRLDEEHGNGGQYCFGTSTYQVAHAGRRQQAVLINLKSVFAEHDCCH